MHQSNVHALAFLPLQRSVTCNRHIFKHQGSNILQQEQGVNSVKIDPKINPSPIIKVFTV